MIRILLADDHLLFAQGLATILNQESDMMVVDIITSVQEIEDSVKEKKPTIILLDVNFNESETGIQICKKLTKQHRAVKIIAVSMYHEYRHIVGMKNAGSVGYLPKNSGRDEILEAIHIVTEGGTYFRGVVEQVLNSRLVTDQNSHIDLNPKEKKVLEKIKLGYTSRQIASDLSVSEKTIEFYRSNLFIKFGAKNAIELINKTQGFYG